ncbi:hypothetical protein chiPu_0030719 [Chiloscyllium punctatum]|uniref:Transgelin n=1 Tax=Chiloscyllium punctatum TaxID=137246 RepID=A0A401TVD5_CHIPU|nr:hypothetical protein [Chiloscyllium punctatum]
MANQGPKYGFSRQVQQKIDQKYDGELEELLVRWILIQCNGETPGGKDLQRPPSGKSTFHQWLKDGSVSRNASPRSTYPHPKSGKGGRVPRQEGHGGFAKLPIMLRNVQVRMDWLC